jgi:hypothetical protein
MPQYQGVWTLEQQAQAQSNQQWVTDPNFKNTTLLLQADGTGSGSQNQTFLDGSTNNFFITRNGTTQGSFSPFSQAPGYWGNYFDGSSYLNTSSLAAMPSSFTIEGWVYVTSTSTSRFTNGAFYLDIIIATGSNMKLQFYDGATVSTDAINTFPINTWAHVAVVRSGSGSNNCSFYVNGVRGTQFTCAASFGSSTWQIGALSSFSQYFYGYISNLRFCNSAVYTGSSFTPSTTALTTTSQGASSCILLTCQSNRFLDNSSTAATFTTGGTPSVQAFGPFAPALQWTPDVVGGSGYFDGSGDYLTIANNTNLQLSYSTPFCIEFWLYMLPQSQVNITPICKRVGGTAEWQIGIGVGAGSTYTFKFYTNNNAQTYNSGFTPTLYQWNHFVVSWDSTTLRLFLNGVLGTTYTSPTAITATTQPVGIGAIADGSEAFTGYIGDYRFVKGSAVYTAAFTPPTTPLTAISNTQLLLNYTNAGIYDGTMKNNLETLSNVQVATSPVKYGSGSMSFGSGTANYLAYLNNPGFVFGTGDFTVEFWVNTFDSTACLIRFSTGSTGYWQMAFSVSSIVWQNSQDVNNLYVASCPQAFNGQWHHIAVTRTGGINRLFFDGTLLTSAADTTNYNGSAGNMQIGWDGSNQFTGFIDDLRFTKGVARYIANFTPPQQALPRQ